ncbi:uncharacterized protein KY384_008081 [Bacidia gigantensis]|uniref:uncharacterized protein n=1 Tax=Bacidia gigantensis TaxID=2732470 RepID=UPI001D055869|nr:uncharacterized protein KY384_008081 [Bacidia gigantensis]KAG8526652.1 hypothetical protein KY384_008081 [Bacidia gigantensis]
MAPVGEAYFPPLDRCFDGTQQLWSWELCLHILARPTAPEYDSIKSFLLDPQTQDYILHPTAPFGAPNTQSKSSFETKTSAVNVSPNSHSHYNIKQIKEDSLLLSKETQINELSALRIAVLEWQKQPATELLQSAVSGPEGARLTGVANRSLLLRNDLDLGLSRSQRPTEEEAQGSDESTRRRRMIELLLSERCYILKCSEYILSHYLATRKNVENALPDEKRSGWLREIGLELFTRWAPHGKGKGKSRDHFFEIAAGSIGSRLQALATGSGWSGLGVEQEKVEILWGCCQVIEIVHILQNVQALLQAQQAPVESALILSWFRLMGECGFFEGFQLPYPGFETKYSMPLQSLAALISLTILNVTEALDLLNLVASGNPPNFGSHDSVPYILDQVAVHEINDVLISFAPSAVASLAVMSWSIITQTIREMASAARESREMRQSTRAADKYGGGDSSDTDGYERPSFMPSIRRRSSTSSDTSQQSTLVEDIYDRICITEVDDPVPYLAGNAVEGGKLFDIITVVATEYCTPYGYEHEGFPDKEMRKCLLQLIRACVGFVDYQPAFFSATLAAIKGSERYWDWVMSSSRSLSESPAAFLRDDEMLKSNMFLVALSRFPHESEPILQLSQALTLQDNNKENALVFQELDLFTCQLPLEYDGYRNVEEEQEVDYVELARDYDFDIATAQSVLQSGKAVTARSFNSQRLASTVFRLPEGTRGKVLSNGKPLVVAWNYEYSGLGYLGQVLDCAAVAINSNETDGSPASPEIVGETIAFISALLLSATKTFEESAARHDAAASILNQLSQGVDRDRDIVSVVFQIFENELHKPRKGPDEEDSLNVMIQCVNFTHAILRVMPDRVWPFLGRSGLLGEDGGCLNTIISSIEIVLGRYDFLYGCIRLFDTLVEDVVEKAMSRRTPSKAIARFGAVNLFGSGVSHTIMQKVLFNFQRIMMDVFNSFGTWKFANEADRPELACWLCKIFDKILHYAYDTNSFEETMSQLTAALVPSAKVIADVFLSSSKAELTMEPLIRICAAGMLETSGSLQTGSRRYCIEQTKHALQLLSTLIRVSDILDRRSSHLNNHLYDNIKIFTTLYAAHEMYRAPVVQLLDAIVRAPSDLPQPSSLLAHLGQENAGSFLQMLSVLDRPVRDNRLFVAIWRLLGSIVATRQQWFAHFILTGKRPPRTTKAGTAEQSEKQMTPMLSLALDQLHIIDKLESKRALAMLEFVANAVDYWPQTLQTLHDHPTFLLSVSRFASRPEVRTRNRGANVDEECNKTQMSACIAEILAMYTHWSQEQGSSRFAQEVLEHLHQFAKNANFVPMYNASLHGNLRRNFAAKYQGCSLDDFQRTALIQASLGDSYFYDLDMASKMLSFDPSWTGLGGEGFADEVKRANFNLSIVEAQVVRLATELQPNSMTELIFQALFSSWKSFLIELVAPLAKESRFQKIIAQTVIDCLQANAENALPEEFFQRLMQTRADLAFTLLQTLNEVKSAETVAQGILNVAWETLRNHNTNLGEALGAGDADYHRTLVRILFLALQLHISGGEGPAAATQALNQATNNPAPKPRSQVGDTTLQVALEITSQIVGEGFCSLTTLLHEFPSLVSPADFSLLIAILHSCLQIPGVSTSSEHLMKAFADTQTPRYAAVLLSWSDRLAASGDPIYGEVSIHFLLELSTVQPLAETLAVEGVLSHILTAKIMEALQEKAFGPFDEPPRLFTIWSRGLLPLLLNLLQAVGPSIAAEVAGALNTFPHQLSRASQAFGTSPSSTSPAKNPSKGYFTLSMAQEASSLALIVSILRTFREAGASAAVQAGQIEDVKWDAAQVREDVEGWLTRRGALRDKIVPTSGKEEAWGRMKARRDGGAENRLEERVVDELLGVVGVLGGEDK